MASNISWLEQTHLHSQLAQLSANLADTENLLRMTSVQAGAMRGLGSWHGGLWVSLYFLSFGLFSSCRRYLWALRYLGSSVRWMMANVSYTFCRFMAASKVLGEESVKEQSQTQPPSQKWKARQDGARGSWLLNARLCKTAKRHYACAYGDLSPLVGESQFSRFPLFNHDGHCFGKSDGRSYVWLWVYPIW
jgi:hypothetical protein